MTESAYETELGPEHGSGELRLQRELAALNLLSWALSQSLDMDRVLEVALEVTLDVTGSQTGAIYLLDPASFSVLQQQTQHTIPGDRAQENKGLPLSHSAIQQVITAGEPTIIQPMETGLESLDDNPTWVAFLLKTHDQLQGIMVVSLKDFTPDHSLIMRAIGQHAGMAIENARLYFQAQQDAIQLDRETRRWNVLNKAAVTVGTALNELDVYHSITRELANVGFASLVCVIDDNECEPDEEDTRLLFRIVSISTPRPGLIPAVERIIGLSLEGYCLPQTQSGFIQNAYEQGSASHMQLGARRLAQFLPAPYQNGAPDTIRGVGLSNAIVTPLWANGRPVAVLLTAANDLGPEDVPAFAAFAAQASIAIQNSQLIETERRRRQEAETLSELVVAANSTLEFDQLLKLVVDRLQALFQASACSVSFLEEDQKTFVFRTSTDPGLDVTQEIRFPAEKSIAGRTIREREVQIVNDVDKASDHLVAISRQTGVRVRSLLTAPLFADDVPMGVIQVLGAPLNHFTESDAQLLSTIAALIETAIARARAYDQALQLADSERRQREMADNLRQISMLIGESLDLEIVLERILIQLEQVIHYDSASLMLLTGDQLTIKAIRGFDEPNKFVEFPIDAQSSQLFQEMLISRQPILIPDVKSDNRFENWEGTESIRSWIGVPLVVRDRIIGELGVDSHQVNAFTQHDADLVCAFADQVAIAIENARLHNLLQEYADDLGTRVRDRAAEAHQGRERLMAVLEHAGSGIVITDPKGIIQYANPAWEKLTGRAAAEAITEKVAIISEETFPELFRYLPGPPPGQTGSSRELVHKHANGDSYVAELTVTPILEDSGNSRRIVNFVVVYRDVTEQKKLDRTKSQFLSTAAHQLRTPLTSIVGFTELLMIRGHLSDGEQKRFLSLINEQAQHLKDLVENLFDISQFEAGEGADFEMERVKIKPLLEEEIQSWQDTNPEHKYVLQFQGVCPDVVGDPKAIARQIVHNLLSNATKYSSPGSTVTISACPVGRFVEMTVADEGIGMSSEEIELAFEKFWRADDSSTAVEGTGLGLVVTRYIIEHHGGDIWIESVQGEGTVVHFTLTQADRRTTVLVVEDEDAIREIEARILGSDGLATLEAGDGPQAVEMALAHRPDLILLDLMLPGMSGLDVLYTLKNNPATAKIPVLVVSARSGWQVIEETRELGAVDFVSKPFEYEELISRARHVLKMNTNQHPKKMRQPMLIQQDSRAD